MHCFELIQSAGCFPLPWGGWWSWVSALSRLCPSCLPVFLSCCFASTLKPYCSQACGFHGTLHPSQQNHSIKEWLGSSSEGSRLFNEGIYNGGLYLGNVFFLWFASEYDETCYPILLHWKANLGASCESWSFNKVEEGYYCAHGMMSMFNKIWPKLRDLLVTRLQLKFFHLCKDVTLLYKVLC